MRQRTHRDIVDAGGGYVASHVNADAPTGLKGSTILPGCLTTSAHLSWAHTVQPHQVGARIERRMYLLDRAAFPPDADRRVMLAHRGQGGGNRPRGGNVIGVDESGIAPTHPMVATAGAGHRVFL